MRNLGLSYLFSVVAMSWLAGCAVDGAGRTNTANELTAISQKLFGSGATGMDITRFSYLICAPLNHAYAQHRGWSPAG